MEVQRRRRSKPAVSDAPPSNFCGIGEELDQLVITRRGLKRYSLHTCPDLVVERIARCGSI
jgi:hypothetical protein